jgi:hypothetical protein
MLALRDLLISSDPLARRRPGFRAGDKLVRSWPKGKCSMEVNSSPSAWKRWTRPTLERPPYELRTSSSGVISSYLSAFLGAPDGNLRHSRSPINRLRSAGSQRLIGTQPITSPGGTWCMPRLAMSF